MSGGNLKKYSIKDLREQVKSLRKDNVLLKKRYCGPFIKENEALQKDNEGLTADNETLLKKHNELQGTLLQLSNKISEAEKKYSMLVEENLEKESTTNEERKQLEQNLAKAKKSIQDLKAQYNNITRDLEETFNALNCEGDDVVACANDTTEKITNAEDKIRDLETKLQTTTQELNKLSESCTEYRGVVQEMRTTEEALLKELEECTMAKDNRLDIIEQIDSTIKEVLGCSEDGYVVTCAQEAADKLNIAERKIKDIKDELQTAARNHENTEKANQALSENIEEIEGKIRKTKEVLGCKKNDDVAECAERMVQERNSTIERLKKTVEEKSAKVAEKSATITQLKIDAGELEEILNQMSYPKPEVESAFGCEPFESLEDCAQRVLRDKNDDYEETSTYEMSEVARAFGCETEESLDQCAKRILRAREKYKGALERAKIRIESRDRLLQGSLKQKKKIQDIFACEPGESLEECARRVMRNENDNFEETYEKSEVSRAFGCGPEESLDQCAERIKDESNTIEVIRRPDIIDNRSITIQYPENPATAAQGTEDGWAIVPSNPTPQSSTTSTTPVPAVPTPPSSTTSTTPVPAVPTPPSSTTSTTPVPAVPTPSTTSTTSTPAPPPPRAPRGDWGFAPRTVAAAMVPPYTSLPMTMRNNFRPVLGV